MLRCLFFFLRPVAVTAFCATAFLSPALYLPRALLPAWFARPRCCDALSVAGSFCAPSPRRPHCGPSSLWPSLGCGPRGPLVVPAAGFGARWALIAIARPLGVSAPPWGLAVSSFLWSPARFRSHGLRCRPLGSVAVFAGPSRPLLRLGCVALLRLCFCPAVAFPSLSFAGLHCPPPVPAATSLRWDTMWLVVSAPPLLGPGPSCGLLWALRASAVAAVSPALPPLAMRVRQPPCGLFCPSLSAVWSPPRWPRELPHCYGTHCDPFVV